MSSLPFPAKAKSTSILVVAMGWQSGIRSAVLLAAEMPAIRATERTSPFLAAPRRIKESVAGFIRTSTAARAVRWVTGFSPTSTIRAAPERSRWVNRVMRRLSQFSSATGRRPAYRRSTGAECQRRLSMIRTAALAALLLVAAAPPQEAPPGGTPPPCLDGKDSKPVEVDDKLIRCSQPAAEGVAKARRDRKLRICVQLGGRLDNAG